MRAYTSIATVFAMIAEVNDFLDDQIESICSEHGCQRGESSSVFGNFQIMDQAAGGTDWERIESVVQDGATTIFYLNVDVNHNTQEVDASGSIQYEGPHGPTDIRNFCLTIESTNELLEQVMTVANELFSQIAEDLAESKRLTAGADAKGDLW